MRRLVFHTEPVDVVLYSDNIYLFFILDYIIIIYIFTLLYFPE